MPDEKVFLIINPRAGQDMTHFPDMMTVFAAAGWDVDNALVEYGGQEKKLAMKAMQRGYSLLIAHGGDGTISDVVEAVLSADKQARAKTVVGAISGGTANQWIHEIGYPTGQVQAALALVNSEVRHVDVGRISVEHVSFPAAQHQKEKAHKKAHEKAARYFLLTAGFGIDAAIISHTSKTLKERIGTLAYDVAATKELPAQHPFYVELHSGHESSDKKASSETQQHPHATGESQESQGVQKTQGAQENRGDTETAQYQPTGQSWRGQALQIVVGNTRRYADVVELTPDAYIDDGLLDICIITDGGTLNTVQQVASLLFKKKPDNTGTFLTKDAHFTITLPASIAVQLDGGTIDHTHLLSAAEQDALNHQTDRSQVLITYRIDVLPQALAVSVPRTYDNTLFSHVQPAQTLHQSSEKPIEEDTSLPSKTLTQQPFTQTQIETLMRGAQFITVTGVAPNAARPHTYIVAGMARQPNTNDNKPVAIVINEDTHLHARNGEPRLPEDIQALPPESTLFVAGKENKRGVIQATQIIL